MDENRNCILIGQMAYFCAYLSSVDAIWRFKSYGNNELNNIYVNRGLSCVYSAQILDEEH